MLRGIHEVTVSEWRQRTINDKRSSINEQLSFQFGVPERRPNLVTQVGLNTKARPYSIRVILTTNVPIAKNVARNASNCTTNMITTRVNLGITNHYLKTSATRTSI